MPSCLIVDDNKVARLVLRQMIEKSGKVDIAGECEDALSAKEFIERQPVDILFLDVEMPTMSGLELLRLLHDRPLTILTTAKQGYAVEAFELNVVDYLVKPFTLSRVMLAIERASELLNHKDAELGVSGGEDSLFIKDNKVFRKVKLDEILWAEAKGDYISISTAQKKYILHASLRSFEEKLPAQRFMRVHRSYVIALDKIDYIEDRVVYIHNNPIPISDSYKDDLLRKLNLL
ncbi:MAG: LytTR family DNA-binding domain-containing protein [Niabella sp.]